MFSKVKLFFSSFAYPRGIELLAILAMVGVYMLSSTFTLNGDGSYGYNMHQRLDDPWAFADNDLAVMGSLDGNFILYRLLYYVPFFSKNFVLADFIISFPISILLIFAWYNIFYLMTRNRFVTVVSIFFMLFVGARFAIGGSTIPLFYLSPITSVLFAQTFALLFYLKGSRVWTMAIVSATTYLHPSSGIFFMCAYGLLFLLDAYNDKNYRKFVAAAVLSTLIFLPNIFIAGSRIGEIGDPEKFFRIFYSLNGPGWGHIYIRSYPMAYLFTLTSLLLILVMFFRKKINLTHTATIIKLISIGFVLVGLWLIDVYFVHNVQVFYLYFATRMTYLIKPLFILFFVSAAYGLYQQRTMSSKAVIIKRNK